MNQRRRGVDTRDTRRFIDSKRTVDEISRALVNVALVIGGVVFAVAVLALRRIRRRPVSGGWRPRADPDRSPGPRGLSAPRASGRVRHLPAQGARLGRRPWARPSVESPDPSGRRHAREHAVRRRDPGDPQGRARPEAARRVAGEPPDLRPGHAPEVCREQVDLLRLRQAGRSGAHDDGARSRPLRGRLARERAGAVRQRSDARGRVTHGVRPGRHGLHDDQRRRRPSARRERPAEARHRVRQGDSPARRWHGAARQSVCRQARRPCRRSSRSAIAITSASRLTR